MTISTNNQELCKNYNHWYEQSLKNPDAFWAAQARARLHWQQGFTQISQCNFNDARISWFADGKMNVAANCLDRHLATHPNKPAIIWEANDSSEPSRTLTYKELHAQTCKAAAMLQRIGVKRGDTVTIYLPMIIEAAVLMLACARIGAVHSVVFGGFSPEALRQRLNDAGSKLLITADEGRRGTRFIPLKSNADAAAQGTSVQTILTIAHTGNNVPWSEPRDIWYHDAIANTDSALTDAPALPAENPLFILYTSGSTGTPKGIMHSSAGYLLYAQMTFELVFDYQEHDIFWCTADIGWITGHSYMIYGPLAAGATTVLFEGIPNYPDAGRIWDVVDKHQVTQLYTAPTAIRMLMAAGDEFCTRSSRQSLRVLGTVGEPINPAAWDWYHTIAGQGRCPIVDTWWQTETGGHLITSLPAHPSDKAGCATKPFFGIEPILLGKSDEVETEQQGALCIAQSWPGQARSIWGDHERFKKTYFTDYAGYYFSGDGARKDSDGDYWITGRMDDVLNVSGHRLGTAEIESALVAHPHVAEAAIVGFPHPVKGEAIYAFVTTTPNTAQNKELIADLKQHVRQSIGAIATPDIIQFTPEGGAPKTRSGKIMRRILRKIAHNDTESLGDTSTLLNPEVVEPLITQSKR